MTRRFYTRTLISLLSVLLIANWTDPNQSLCAGPQLAANEAQPPAAEIRDLAFNNVGDIVYLIPEGIFIKPFDQGRPKVMVGTGQRVPGLRRGTFQSFTNVAFNNVGTIAFTATIAGGQAPRGIFIRTPSGVIEPIIFEGSLVQGVRGRFSEFGRLELTDRVSLGGPVPIPLPQTEVIVFKAAVQDGLERREGLFAAPVVTKVASVIALQGASAGGPGFYDTLGEFSAVGFAELPIGIVRIAFQANLVRGRSSQGIFLSTVVPAIAELASPLVLSGDDAPGQGVGKYAEFHRITYNKNEIAFTATLTGGKHSGGIFEIAFIGPVHFVNLKLLIGSTAPGGPGFYTEFGELSSNNMQELVYRAQVENKGEIHEGLFKVSLGPFTIENDIARLGLKAPRNEGTVTAIGKFIVNDEGKTAFHAMLDGGTAKEGIYTTWANKLFATGITR